MDTFAYLTTVFALYRRGFDAFVSLSASATTNAERTEAIQVLTDVSGLLMALTPPIGYEQLHLNFQTTIRTAINAVLLLVTGGNGVEMQRVLAETAETFWTVGVELDRRRRQVEAERDADASASGIE